MSYKLIKKFAQTSYSSNLLSNFLRASLIIITYLIFKYFYTSYEHLKKLTQTLYSKTFQYFQSIFETITDFIFK